MTNVLKKVKNDLQKQVTNNFPTTETNASDVLEYIEIPVSEQIDEQFKFSVLDTVREHLVGF